MEISSGIFIYLLHLTRSSCEKWQDSTCSPAIPVQRSKQLSYRETVVERLTTRSCGVHKHSIRNFHLQLSTNPFNKVQFSLHRAFGIQTSSNKTSIINSHNCQQLQATIIAFILTAFPMTVKS